MKINILLISLMVASINIWAQTELVIEVTTDKYPDETSWKLYDLSNNLVAMRTEFEKEQTHYDTLILDDASCYYWTIYDSYSDGMDATNPGDYKLYVNQELFAACADPNFGDSISVYGLGASCIGNDASVHHIAMLDYISKGENWISFEIINMGNANLTQLTVNYQVNDFESSAYTMGNLDIPVGQSQTITIPVQYNFDQAGDYVVTVTLQSVNGETDMATINNSASKTVTVVDGILQKNMVEMVSSAYCGPCYDANESINNILFSNQGTWTLSKYLLDWGDKKYVPGNDHRFDLYNVGGAPYVFINGESRNYNTFSETTYKNEYLGNVTDIKIELDGYIMGDSIFATFIIIPQNDIRKVTYLRGVAVEYFCTENLKSGAEYYHATYGYLPTPEGIRLDSMNFGDTLIFDVTNCVVKYPLEEGSLTDMILNVYVQEENTNIIHQSESINLTYTQLQPQTWFGIADNSTDINPDNVSITFQSNRVLFDENNEFITNVTNHLRMKKGNLSGVSVPFNAELNTAMNAITITPNYTLENNTTYYVIAKNFSTIDGIEIPNDTLQFTTTTGVNVNGLQKPDVYPNPAKQILIIKTQTASNFYLYDINGRLLLSAKLQAGENKINIHDLTAGVYYIQIMNNKNIEKVKFLKQ